MIVRRPLARPAVASLPLAALIDCVFLLIIYFMLSGTLEQQEADLRFSLPGTAPLAASLALPDTPLIQIDTSGRAHVNGYGWDMPSQPVYRSLAAMLHRYAEGAAAARTEAAVLIAPAAQTPHWAIVRVMDACALAGIGKMAFVTQADGGEPLSGSL